MSSLANLSRLTEQATPGPWESRTGHPSDVLTAWETDDRRGRLVICEHAGIDADLIAAAPQMADLLVGLDEHLDKCGCIPRTEAVCVGCRVRARLADFDRRLT